jgi:ferredoxin-NADP reductase
LFPSRLVEKIPLVADIVTFRFERPPGHEYRAGQWFVITFPGPTEPYEHHFSYSSSPTEPFLEFTTRLRGSAFKNALDALALGTDVEVEGPYGAFTLQEGLDRVVFIAGGIGITCARSILRWLADSGGASGGAGLPTQTGGAPSRWSGAPLPAAAAQPREIVLLFANRAEDGIPFREELAQMEAALPGLRVVHVLSHPGAAWPGDRGHIDDQILSRELPEPDRWAYYLSGPPSFDQTMRDLLTRLGIGAGSIKMERFEGYE